MGFNIWRWIRGFFGYYFGHRNLSNWVDHWATKLGFFCIGLFTLICTIYVDIIAKSHRNFLCIAPWTVFSAGDEVYEIDEALTNETGRAGEKYDFLILFDESGSVDLELEGEYGSDKDEVTNRIPTLKKASANLENILCYNSANDTIYDEEIGLPRLLTCNLLDILEMQYADSNFQFSVCSFDETCKLIGQRKKGFTPINKDNIAIVRNLIDTKPIYKAKTDFVAAFDKINEKHLKEKYVDEKSEHNIVLTIISDFNDDQNRYIPDFRDALGELRLKPKLQINLVILPSYDVERSEKVIELFREQFTMDRLSIYYIRELTLPTMGGMEIENHTGLLASMLAPKFKNTRHPLRFNYEEEHFQKSESSITIEKLVDKNVLFTLRTFGNESKTYISTIHPEGSKGFPHDPHRLLKKNYSVPVNTSGDESVTIQLEHYSKYDLPELSLEVFRPGHRFKILIPIEYVKQLPMWGATAMLLSELGSIVFLLLSFGVFMQIQRRIGFRNGLIFLAREKKWAQGQPEIVWLERFERLDKLSISLEKRSEQKAMKSNKSIKDREEMSLELKKIRNELNANKTVSNLAANGTASTIEHGHENKSQKEEMANESAKKPPTVNESKGTTDDKSTSVKRVDGSIDEEALSPTKKRKSKDKN